MAMITVKEIKNEFYSPIPASHLDLIGVKLGQEPHLLDLDLELEFLPGSTTLSIWLVVNPDCNGKKRIKLDTNLPYDFFTGQLGIPFQEMFKEGFSIEDLLKRALVVIVKRSARIRIEKLSPPHLRVSLSVGDKFKSDAKCTMYDLVGFIEVEETNDLELTASFMDTW